MYLINWYESRFSKAIANAGTWIYNLFEEARFR
jgi:hypothetical protein